MKWLLTARCGVCYASAGERIIGPFWLPPDLSISPQLEAGEEMEKGS
jgi:hypothetical protein